jgi:molybdate transport system substrate-binding protein
MTLILIIGIRVLNETPLLATTHSNLLVSAAASLKEVLEEIKPVYQQVNSPVEIKYNFGASGTLQQQIENGAPADIFFSAATKQMDALQQKNLIIPETRRNLLTNRLVLIVPKTSTNISSFRNLTDATIKRIAVGEPRSVPVGQYTEEVFKNLGILDSIKPKLVFGNTVRNVLAAVETGNVDAGVVYATDAKLSNQVKVVVAAPTNLHSAIVYPIAVLKGTKNPNAAKEYVQFLASDRGFKIFQKYGFSQAS